MRIRTRTRSVVVAAALAAGLLPAAAPAAIAPAGAAAPSVSGAAPGVHSPNMAFVANVRYPDALRNADGIFPLYGVGARVDGQSGTDLETATLVVPDVPGLPEGVEAGQERDYAFSGTYRNGLQVVDITDPAAPVLAATYPCDLFQGDVQVFSRGERTYVSYTHDYSGRTSRCFTDAGRAGAPTGALLIDVTNPYEPRSVGFVPLALGSHNATVHPSGEYLYNSNSDDLGDGIEVVSLADVAKPAVVDTVALPGVQQSHDITFSADGTRAYAAALDHTAILDTTNPAKPVVVGSIVDPAITLHHQADPVTVGARTFLVINDELNGAGGNEVCPGGGLHVYDVTGDLEKMPRKVGAFFAPDVTVREGAPTGLGSTVSCTAHVFRIYPEQGLLTIAWFGAGVRVIDLNGLEGVSVGVTPATGSLTPGMKEVGYYRFPADSDAWAAKVHRFDEDGSFHLFANDQTRGFDVFRYTASAPKAADAGSWLTPEQALARATRLRATPGFTVPDAPWCNLASSVRTAPQP